MQGKLAYASKGPRLAQTLFGLVTQSYLITGQNDCVRNIENFERIKKYCHSCHFVPLTGDNRARKNSDTAEDCSI